MKESRKTVPKRSDAHTEPVQRPRVAERPASSHLDRTAAMRRLSDFEFRMERLAQAYYRWKAACFSAVCSVALSGDDVAVLNVVRMGDEPKRLSEIGQLLNRVDVPNLQYATRKLVKAGLIETEGKPSRKETRYRTTDAGREITDAYATLRGATLPPLFDALEEGVRDLEKMSVQMDLFASLYGQAAQVALSQRCLPTEHLAHEDLELR